MPKKQDKIFVVLGLNDPMLHLHIEHCPILGHDVEFDSRRYIIVKTKAGEMTACIGFEAQETYEGAFEYAAQALGVAFSLALEEACEDAAAMLKDEDILEGKEDRYAFYAKRAVDRSQRIQCLEAALYALTANKLDYHVKRARRKLK